MTTGMWNGTLKNHLWIGVEEMPVRIEEMV